MADHVEKFAPTGGRILGMLAIALGLGVVLVWLVDKQSGVAPWFVMLAAFWTVAAWAAFLRPRLAVHGRHLVMRGMIDTVRIPLRMIDSVAVRQVTAVGVAGKRYVSPAVSRSRRDLARQDAAPGRGRGSSQGTLAFGGIFKLAAEEGNRSYAADSARGASYGLFVQERVLLLAKDAQQAPALEHDDAPAEDRVVRILAWPEIVGMAVTGLATVLLIILR